ncbi:hypothetical protein D9M68_868660 [compost metagenome]
MRKPGHAGVAAGKIAPPAVLRRMHELDAVAGRVDETEEVAHVALFGLFPLARRDRIAAAFQHRAGALQFFGSVHLERGGMVPRVALEIAEGMVARVGLEIGGAMFLARQFQPQDRGRVADRALQVAGTQPDVPDIV